MGHVALVFNAMLQAVEWQLPHGGEVQEGKRRPISELLGECNRKQRVNTARPRRKDVNQNF